MSNKYWNNEVPKYTELFNALVPDSGNCNTLEGELIRAATRLNYDYFNNGNCNNTSGANIFLKKHLPNQSDAVKAALKAQYNECNLGGYTTIDLSNDLDVIMDAVLEYVITRTEYAPNTRDMFDYQEPDADYFEDEDY